jgi:hypothetical protein
VGDLLDVEKTPSASQFTWSLDGKMVAVNQGFNQPARDTDGLSLISLAGDDRVVSVAQLDPKRTSMPSQPGRRTANTRSWRESGG